MIQNSWSYAAAQGLLRRNEVHGEEEARLILEDYFEKKSESGQERRSAGSTLVEAWALAFGDLGETFLFPQDEDDALLDSDPEPDQNLPKDPQLQQEAAKQAAAAASGNKKLLTQHVYNMLQVGRRNSTQDCCAQAAFSRSPEERHAVFHFALVASGVGQKS